MVTTQSHEGLPGDRIRTGTNMRLLMETKKASPDALTPTSITQGQARPTKASGQHIHADRHMDLKISCSSAGLLQDQPGQHQDQQEAAQYQQLQQPETPASACRSHPSQLMQIQHSSRPPAAAADITSAIPASGICPSSMLDRVLTAQGMVQVSELQEGNLVHSHSPSHPSRFALWILRLRGVYISSCWHRSYALRST